MHPYTAFKEYQKTQALLIRTAKSKRKSVQYGYIPELGPMRHNYRLKHIAYCEVRGRSRDQIEKPSIGKKLSQNDERSIESIKRTLSWDIEHFERERESRIKSAATG